MSFFVPIQRTKFPYATKAKAYAFGSSEPVELRLITMNVNDVSKASKLASDSGTDTNINTDIPPVAQKTGVFHFIYANS